MFSSERFAFEPTGSGDAHRPLPSRVDLGALFAETEERMVANGVAIDFGN